jgi:methylmalonyl-CoA mutase cobalamin-binding subunit
MLLDLKECLQQSYWMSSIYGKVADFTSEMIEKLIEKGKQDAQRVFGIQ